jgi:hypothetical protein
VKRLCIFLLLLCSFMPLLRAQQHLLLFNPENRHLKMFYPGQWVKIKYQLQGQKSHNAQGYLIAINDSALRLMKVHPLFHKPRIDTLEITVAQLTRIGTYHPVGEPLLRVGNALVWTTGAIVLVTASGGGVAVFLLTEAVALPVSYVSEKGLSALFYPLYPLNGKRWRHVTDEQLRRLTSPALP